MYAPAKSRVTAASVSCGTRPKLVLSCQGVFRVSPPRTCDRETALADSRFFRPGLAPYSSDVPRVIHPCGIWRRASGCGKQSPADFGRSRSDPNRRSLATVGKGSRSDRNKRSLEESAPSTGKRDGVCRLRFRSSSSCFALRGFALMMGTVPFGEVTFDRDRRSLAEWFALALQASFAWIAIPPARLQARSTRGCRRSPRVGFRG